MRAIECPNCYSTVILNENGLCPACNRGLNAPTADGTRTKVTIREGQDLPDVCFLCGNQTSSMLVIRRSSSSRSFRVLKIILGVVLFPLKILIFGLSRVISDEEGTRCYQSLKVKVPVCLKCRDRNPLQIVGTNFEEGTISFVVPRSVRDEIQKMRAAQGSGGNGGQRR